MSAVTFLLGFLFVVSSQTMQGIPEAQAFQRVAVHFCRLLPPFNLGEGLINLSAFNILSKLVKDIDSAQATPSLDAAAAATTPSSPSSSSPFSLNITGAVSGGSGAGFKNSTRNPADSIIPDDALPDGYRHTSPFEWGVIGQNLAALYGMALLYVLLTVLLDTWRGDARMREAVAASCTAAWGRVRGWFGFSRGRTPGGALRPVTLALMRLGRGGGGGEDEAGASRSGGGGLAGAAAGGEYYEQDVEAGVAMLLPKAGRSGGGDGAAAPLSGSSDPIADSAAAAAAAGAAPSRAGAVGRQQRGQGGEKEEEEEDADVAEERLRVGMPEALATDAICIRGLRKVWRGGAGRVGPTLGGGGGAESEGEGGGRRRPFGMGRGVRWSIPANCTRHAAQQAEGRRPSHSTPLLASSPRLPSPARPSALCPRPRRSSPPGRAPRSPCAT